MIQPHWLFYNGEYLPANSSFLSVHNRSFRYGDSLFETIRVKNQKIKYLDLHIKRLLKGLQLLGFVDAEKLVYQKVIENIFLQLKSRNNIESQYAKLRIQVIRSGTGLYTPNSNEIDILIELNSYPNNYDFFNDQKTINIGVSKKSFVPITPFSGLKVANALTYVMAAVEKSERKLDDLLLLDKSGNISECISSNVFIYHPQKNILYAPSLDTGCLDGVLRRVLLENAKNNKIEVVEDEFLLLDFDFEKKIVFTTNSGGISIVNQIESIYQLNIKTKESFYNSHLFKILKDLD
jgi:branched-subunit amino acid aminotransferase/4-amino-4-deoxychorismate lyase